MPVVEYKRISTGIPWVDSLLRAFHEDPMGGLSPAPIASPIIGGVSPGGRAFVSPYARWWLRLLGQRGAEAIPSPSRLHAAASWAESTKLHEPTRTLPMPIARWQSVYGDVNTPQVVMEVQAPPGLEAAAKVLQERYLRELNRLLSGPSPVAGEQAKAYERLLAELIRGGLQ